jgi:hypothetical protein
MLSSSLPYKEAFDNLAVDDANFTTCPTAEEWEEIQAMNDFLEIFKEGMFYFSFLHPLISNVDTSSSFCNKQPH